jgi:hypothetical protein
MVSPMTATSNGSTKPSATPSATPAKRTDYSTLPEHMRERARLNEIMSQQMRAECKAKGIKTL